jgi:hypothetical protein
MYRLGGNAPSSLDRVACVVFAIIFGLFMWALIELTR